MRIIEHAVHGWDLARSIGADDQIDPEVTHTGPHDLRRRPGAARPVPASPPAGHRPDPTRAATADPYRSCRLTFAASRASRKASHCSAGPDAHPQPARQTDVADQHALVEQRLPDRFLVGEPAEQHEVGIGVDHVEPAARNDSTIESRSARSVATCASVSSACRSAASAAAWVSADRWYGKPDQPQRVDNGGIGGEISDPRAGERERLRHRPGHHHAAGARRATEAATGGGRTPRTPRRRRPCPGATSTIASSDRRVDRGAGRVVRRAQEHDVRRSARRTARTAASADSVKSGSRAAATHAVPVRERDQPVHRVRRVEAQRACDRPRRTRAAAAAAPRWIRSPPRPASTSRP